MAKSSKSKQSLSWKYWGSRRSNKYHLPNCWYKALVSAGNIVTFASVKDAKAKGYEPCRLCKPPESD